MATAARCLVKADHFLRRARAPTARRRCRIPAAGRHRRIGSLLTLNTAAARPLAMAVTANPPMLIIATATAFQVTGAPILPRPQCCLAMSSRAHYITVGERQCAPSFPGKSPADRHCPSRVASPGYDATALRAGAVVHHPALPSLPEPPPPAAAFSLTP